MSRPEPAARPLRIAVCGAGRASETELELAERVGRALARAGAVVVCGGLGGVMEAVARGAASVGGVTIGLLPGDDAESANPCIALPIATGLGEARNVLVARSCDALVAIGGEWGTLSEVALARKLGRPVVLLQPTLAAGLPLPQADSAEDAARAALEAARAGRNA